MSIKIEDAKKATEAHVTDSRTGEVTKVVYLQDTQVGASNSPKALDVTGAGLIRQNLYVSGNIHVSGSIFSIERSYLTGVGPLYVTTESNGQVYINTQDEATPNAFSGLKMWLEAATANVTLSSTGVVEWLDLSGNQNHLSQPTGVRRPLWVSSNPDISGSQPSIDFQSSHLLTSSNNIPLSTFTVIIALRNKTNGALIFEHGDDASLNDGAWLYGGRGASGASLQVIRQSTPCSRDMSTSTWSTNSDFPSIFTMIHGGTSGSLRLYIDNVDMRELTTPAANNLTESLVSAKFNLGARTTFALPMSGSIYALALFSPSLSPFQAAKVARYFGRKLGIHVV